MEVALAVAVTQMDLFNRLLDTTPLSAGQFLLALASRCSCWSCGRSASSSRGVRGDNRPMAFDTLIATAGGGARAGEADWLRSRGR